MHRFSKAAGAWNTGGTWSNEGAYTAELTWMPAPAGYPTTKDYLEGDVRNAAGVVTGRLTLGWVSEFLRRATIEIDKVSASETPLDNGAGVGWEAAFGDAGWQINLDVSETSVPEPSGASWSYAECHQGLLDHRDENNLDAEWRYYVLCIRNHDDPDACRGVMFDAYGHDANNIPREGCVVCSHWMIPNEPPWGTVKGQRYGATVVYFRTAVHEASHSMCLYHNWDDNGFMCTTDVIAENDPVNFPANTQWSFHPDDLKRLRHMPDIFVRPGGLPFGVNYPIFISPDDLAADINEDFEFHVMPMLDTVPLGAPVRVELDLRNISGQPLPAPESLSFKSGRVSGWVVDPSGTVRTFSPILLYADHEPMITLEPNQSLAHSLTLLRGGQGALFPAPGMHQVVVEVHWELGGVEVHVQAACEVLVTAAVDEAHAIVAHRMLTTPDVMLTLVLGGDHLPEGIAAIQAALANPVLRPHYAYVEARRLAEHFRKRKPNPRAAARLINEETVMNASELKKAIKLAKSGVPKGTAHDKLTRGAPAAGAGYAGPAGRDQSDAGCALRCRHARKKPSYPLDWRLAKGQPRTEGRHLPGGGGIPPQRAVFCQERPRGADAQMGRWALPPGGAQPAARDAGERFQRGLYLHRAR